MGRVVFEVSAKPGGGLRSFREKLISVRALAPALVLLPMLGGCMVSTPLHMAIEGRDTTEAMRLIKKSKDVDRPNGVGETALHAAAKTGQVKTASALLEKGALTSRRDKNGETPLIDACANGHGETAKVLVAAGSDMTETDLLGNTCLLRAARQGHLPLVKLALKSGGDIQHRNNSGTTALTMAATGSHDGTARHLIKNGARIDIANDFGITAYDVAVEKDDRSLAKSLLQSGANPSVFSDTVPRPGWQTAQSHFFAADYYEKMDRPRSLTYYRMAEKHYARAVDEWKGDARRQNGAIAGAVFSSLLIVAVAGAGASTPSIHGPIKARAHAGSMRKKAETRLGISQKKVLELGG